MASLSTSSATYPSLPSDDEKKQEKYRNIIESLPTERRWPPHTMLQYKGFWFADWYLLHILSFCETFKARETDMFLVSFPKSGATWTKALLFATLHRKHHSSLAQHPLRAHTPHECVPFVEIPTNNTIPDWEAMASPRLLSTHIPFSLLPESIVNSNCRIVYVCRGPKDAFVSMWHFRNAIFHEGAEVLNLEDAFKLFCQGIVDYGPLWSHTVEYWQESLTRPEKVLFMKYEEMMEDPTGSLKKMAAFMGCPFSEDEEREGKVEEILSMCSFEKLSQLEVNTNGALAEFGKYAVKNSSFFRKGKVGDWRSHLTEEMGREVDEIVKEKLSGSNLIL